MLIHYYINESWKTRVKWNERRHKRPHVAWFFFMKHPAETDRWLTGEKRNEVQMVSFWNYIVVVGHSGYIKISELCILRVSILWYVNCTNTKQVNKSPYQTAFFTTVSGQLLSHRNIQVTATILDMDNCTATNATSNPYPPARQVFFHWAISPGPLLFLLSRVLCCPSWPSTKPEWSNATTGTCHHAQTKFLFKRTVCGHQLIAHML